MKKPTLAAGSINTAIYTSPRATADLDPLPALLAMIGSAKKSILFSAYAFTSSALANAILARWIKYGVSVQGVCDASEYASATSQLPSLVSIGMNIRCWGNTYRLNHEKVIIVDGDIVALGSFNFTTQAEAENKEVLLILSGKQVTKILAPTLAAQIQATYDAGTAPPSTGGK